MSCCLSRVGGWVGGGETPYHSVIRLTYPSDFDGSAGGGVHALLHLEKKRVGRWVGDR